MNIRSVCDIFLLSIYLVTPGHSAESSVGSGAAAEDVSVWSREVDADESLAVSQQLIDGLLGGMGTQLENEECLMGISSRLQTALEKMLMAITDSTNQVQTQRCWLSAQFMCLTANGSFFISAIHSISFPI